MKLILNIIAILMMATLTGCSAEPASQIHQLPSGKEVKILAMGPVIAPFSKDTPTIMLKYQTNLDLGNKKALKAEVDELFWDFKKEVLDHSQFKAAVISANTPPQGFIITTNKGENFVYQRNKDNVWQRIGTL